MRHEAWGKPDRSENSVAMERNASTPHLLDELRRSECILKPDQRELNQVLQIVDVLILPLPCKVSFVITQPRRASCALTDLLSLIHSLIQAARGFVAIRQPCRD